jgi:DNA-binding beta-propeller fold protein YncE
MLRVAVHLALALCGTFSLLACGGAQTETATTEPSASPNGDTGARRGPTSIPVDGDPNGLFWDETAAVLYVADAKNNRVLKWTDAAGFSTAAELPPAPPEGGGLGQVVKLPDGKLVVTRFGHGKAGDVVYANPDGTSGTVPKLDPLRRRIGLAATSDGTLYEAFFFSKDGVKSGGIARIDLTGTEAEVIGGLKKPVGVLALGGELVVSDQVAGTILRVPVASPDKQAVVAKVPEPDLLCAGPEGTFFTGGKAGSVRQVMGSGEVKELSGGFQDVRGVAYDGKNKRLFVADHDRNETDGIAHLLRILPVD